MAKIKKTSVSALKKAQAKSKDSFKAVKSGSSPNSAKTTKGFVNTNPPPGIAKAYGKVKSSMAKKRLEDIMARSDGSPYKPTRGRLTPKSSSGMWKAAASGMPKAHKSTPSANYKKYWLMKNK